jgi:hypothetical protein
VTPERLVNADREPQDWLMNHRAYDGQRFSPLARINRDTVKGLKVAYTVALGGVAANEYMMSTPLAEDGFLYLTDSAGVLTATAAPPYGAISSLRRPTRPRGLSPPTRIPGESCGRLPSRILRKST